MKIKYIPQVLFVLFLITFFQQLVKAQELGPKELKSLQTQKEGILKFLEENGAKTRQKLKDSDFRRWCECSLSVLDSQSRAWNSGYEEFKILSDALDKLNNYRLEGGRFPGLSI